MNRYQRVKDNFCLMRHLTLMQTKVCSLRPKCWAEVRITRKEPHIQLWGIEASNLDALACRCPNRIERIEKGLDLFEA